MSKILLVIEDDCVLSEGPEGLTCDKSAVAFILGDEEKEPDTPEAFLALLERDLADNAELVAIVKRKRFGTKVARAYAVANDILRSPQAALYKALRRMRLVPARTKMTIQGLLLGANQ